MAFICTNNSEIVKININALSGVRGPRSLGTPSRNFIFYCIRTVQVLTINVSTNICTYLLMDLLTLSLSLSLYQLSV